MSVFRQIGAVVGMNMRSIPRRLGTSCVVVIGIAGVVGVVISIFGMNRSLGQALVDSGRPNRAVVLRNGSDGEGSSTLLVDAVGTIKNAPGIARTPEGDAAASAEMITTANFKRKKGRLASRLADPRLRAAGLLRAAGDQDRRGPSVQAWPARGDRRPRRAEGVPGARDRRQGSAAQQPVGSRRRVRERRRRERVARDRRRVDAVVRVRPHGSEQRDGALDVRGRVRRVQAGAHDEPDAVRIRRARERVLPAPIEERDDVLRVCRDVRRRRHGARCVVRGAQHDVLGRQHARGRDRDAARDRLRRDRRRRSRCSSSRSRSRCSAP